MSATPAPADAVVEAVVPDAYRWRYVRSKGPGNWQVRQELIEAAVGTAEWAAIEVEPLFLEATLRPAIIRQCAAYLDSYAGGHYMAQSCADALREFAQREELSCG